MSSSHPVPSATRSEERRWAPVTRPRVTFRPLPASLTERPEDGQGLAEYALAAGLVAALAAAVVAMTAQALEAVNRAMEIMLNA